MDKLYKVIVLFVGLLALNNTVQAQLASLYPCIAEEAAIGTDSFVPNYYAAYPTIQQHTDNELTAISSFYTFTDVSNFTNYPNPAVSSTTIAYTLSARAYVNLRVIDLAGRQLAVLVRQEQDAGKQELYWELSKNRITSGMYILVLQVDNKIYSRKVIVQ